MVVVVLVLVLVAVLVLALVLVLVLVVMVKVMVVNDGDANDSFGDAVSISGDYAIVGAPNDDDKSTESSGSVYILMRNHTTSLFEISNKIALKTATFNLSTSTPCFLM